MPIAIGVLYREYERLLSASTLALEDAACTR